MPALGPRNPYWMAGWTMLALALIVGTYSSRIACDDPKEIAALEAIRDEAREELFEMQRVANQLNAYRRDVAELEAKIEEGLGVFAGEGPGTDGLSVVSGSSRITADREGEGGSWWIALSGGGGAAEAARVIAEFAPRAPLMRVREVGVDGDSWAAAARIDDVPAKEASAWQLKEYELPPPTWRSKDEAEGLRADIQRTQREMRQLVQIIDPIVDLRKRAEDYRAYLAAREGPFAAERAADLLGRLASFAESPLVNWTIVFGDDDVMVTVLEQPAGWSADELGEVLGEGWSAVVLERGDKFVFRVLPR